MFEKYAKQLILEGKKQSFRIRKIFYRIER